MEHEILIAMKLTLGQLRRVIKEAAGATAEALEKLNAAIDAYANHVADGKRASNQIEADEIADSAARRFIEMPAQDHYVMGSEEWWDAAIELSMGEDDIADMVYVAVFKRVEPGASERVSEASMFKSLWSKMTTPSIDEDDPEAELMSLIDDYVTKTARSLDRHPPDRASFAIANRFLQDVPEWVALSAELGYSKDDIKTMVAEEAYEKLTAKL